MLKALHIMMKVQHIMLKAPRITMKVNTAYNDESSACQEY